MTMKKRNSSPSFRETMYYQHGYPLDGAGYLLRQQQQQQHRQQPEKVKKSFAEKIGKTLDKLSPLKTDSVKQQPPIQVHPSWVYQPYYHVPRVSYGRPPMQKPNAYYYYYPHHPPPPSNMQYPPSHQLNGERQEYCSCPDYIYGTSSRRSKTGRCKRCHNKRIAFEEVASNHQKLPNAYVLHHTDSVRVRKQTATNRAPIPRNLLTYRDPYDYVRRSGSRAPENHYYPYSEDWQNYWDSSEGSSFKRSESPATNHQQQRPTKIFNGSIPVESPTIPREAPPKEEDKNFVNLVTVNVEPETRVQVIKDESSREMEEKTPQKESVNDDDRIDLMKGPDLAKLSAAAEQRLKKLQKKYSPSASSSRKIQIDEVIVEENEEDLLALESLEIVSPSPEVKVKSILKRSSVIEINGEGDIITNDEEQAPEIEAETDEDNYGYRKVRFTEESLSIPPINEEKETPEDEALSGFDKIVLSQNLADEILTEIYGKTSEEKTESRKENGNKEPTLADEILNEIFGGETPKKESSTEDQGANEILQTSDSELNPVLAEFARRFNNTSTFKGRRSSSGGGITRTNSINGNGDSKEAMSRLFNDTTRIRLESRKRRPLSLFSPEFPPRPKDPPPPPPPKPVDEEQEELEILNSEGDEFSSDEFSEDSFEEDTVSEDYVNLPENRRLPPEGAESDNHHYDLAESGSLEGVLLSSQDGGDLQKESNRSLIENSGDKTIIYTSPSVAKSFISSENRNSTPKKEEESKECSSRILISSSSWINVKGEEGEPIKPPRLKKIARQQKQRGKEFSHSRLEHEYVNAAMYKTPNKRTKPEISAPILVATTFNPNDAETHKILSPRDSLQRSTTVSSPDKITFKDIKKFARSFSSLSAFKTQEDYPPSEHIYEEISDETSVTTTTTSRPLPPIPEKRDGSFFEGASKYEILRYLKNAKDRIGHADFEIELSDILGDEEIPSGSNVNSGASFIGKRNQNHRVSAISNASDSSNSSGESGSELLILRGSVNTSVDIERTDSGVGSETSKSSKSRISIGGEGEDNSAPTQSSVENPEVISEDDDYSKEADLEETHYCLDCNEKLHTEDDISTNDRLSMIVCSKCAKRRSERKETITEIIETEIKYGRDLRIIVEEFYRPMLVAGLLTSEQLSSIFLNAEELIQVNVKFTEILKDAIEIALDHGDEDLCTVHIGKLFLESLSMLKAFEYYCTRQGSASMLLTTLEKEKELLRIFLKVSQMENSMLRRMNLSSFLMVPVQRVTKYPLLLSRLHKVTLNNHEDRSSIKLAQEKIEESLELMNKEATKDVNTNKIWKRLPKMSTPASPTKTVDIQAEMGNVRIRKMALDLLGWNRDEIRFPLEGKMLYSQPSEPNWKKVWTVKLTPVSALLAVWSSEELPEITLNKALIFPQESGTIKDASLLLVREKNSRFTLVRDPLPLDRCVVCCEPDWDDCFEIQEFVNKESFVFKGEEPDQTSLWFQTLQYYTQSLGGWRKRRKGLGNIMFDPNFPPTQGTISSSSKEEPSKNEGAEGGEASAAPCTSEGACSS